MDYSDLPFARHLPGKDFGIRLVEAFGTTGRKLGVLGKLQMLVWASGEEHSLGYHKDKASVVKEVRTDTVLFLSKSQSRFFRGLAFKRVRQSLCLCLRSS